MEKKMTVESKASFATLPVKREVKEKMLQLRDRLFPRENISAFVSHMIDVFEEYHTNTNKVTPEV